MQFKSGAVAFCITMIMMVTLVAGQNFADIALPPPKTEGGMPLMQVLNIRHTSRSFSPKKLPVQTLSDLLWAAFGINRSDSNKRTAPSARNWQEIEIYVTMEEGTYLYDAKSNKLKTVVKGDVREKTGGQKFAAGAPLNLVYVADYDKMKGAKPEDLTLYSGADAGFISQNVYLFCASEGLSTVVRGMVDRTALAKVLNITGNKKIVFAQTVGYPHKEEKVPD